jgi:hypothetical protein
MPMDAHVMDSCLEFFIIGRYREVDVLFLSSYIFFGNLVDITHAWGGCARNEDASTLLETTYYY